MTSIDTAPGSVTAPDALELEVDRLRAEVARLKAELARLERDYGGAHAFLPDMDAAALMTPLPERDLGAPRRYTPSWIYFLQGLDGGPIKIGRSTKHPLTRAVDLQIGYPFGTLRVVAAFHSTACDEQRVHNQFRHLRLRGEWFRPAPDLIAFIQIAAAVGCRQAGAK